MGKYHFLPEETKSLLLPGDMNLVYTSVQRFDLGRAVIQSGREELCLVVIEGEAAYSCGDWRGTAAYMDMLYVPPGKTVSLSGENAAVIRYGAPCGRATAFAHIAFADVDGDGRHKHYGDATNGTKRDVWNYIDESFDSSRFLVGICSGALGGWTAWPPHKHGQKREEVYVYFGMKDGFGVQCVYEDMENPGAVVMVKDGHLVAIPEGYHPNAGCPKTGLQYIYCMVSTTAEDRDFMDMTTQSIYGDKLE